MQAAGFVGLGAFLLNNKISFQRLKESRFAETIEVFDHAVVVDDGQLIVREANSHKEVVFLVTPVVGIVPGFFSTDQSSSCRTMVTVSNIESRQLGKQSGDGFDVVLLINDPEMMAKAVGSHKVINRRCGRVSGNNGI
ncbi:MAG: hypothetical protein BWY72_00988 [Bacteroidetes bacterium ADurb.Bin416]|nr:MAG: hypothetical protein BWY72_00988 [Bacteroidetes bacterium ADurb.Bin416]